MSIDTLFGFIDRWNPQKSNFKRLAAAIKLTSEDIKDGFLHQARILFPSIAQRLDEAHREADLCEIA